MSYIGLPSAGSAYWKGPVNSTGDLPASAAVGEVRYVISDNALYAYDGASWNPLTSGGGSSGNAYYPNGWT